MINIKKIAIISLNTEKKNLSNTTIPRQKVWQKHSPGQDMM